ncbi:MAG: hypothetical protein M1823_003196 [Watsoniomyces obsoletus]|nr:MAG: hypothetical protein M1823_003196 [Watsoniomyces obsoletus]
MSSITSSLAIATSSTTAAPSATSSSGPRAKPQGGILDGQDPTVYSATDPITLFIIQAGIIIIFCRLLAFPLAKIRQPRVIAEVVGGILLGPSVMGRIPGFTSTIFPSASMPLLNLVANLGLVLFLFLVGLEADLRLVLSNWRIALSVGAAGMVLPFGLGAALAYGLYHQFNDEPGVIPVGFGVYMLFVGVAMAITAFPVLCRILTELNLLHTPVGVIVLSAGVGNDVVGWILLALCVALVNTGSGLTALWVLLTCVGFVLFVVFAVRPAFVWLLRRNGSIQNGPSQGMMTLTLLMVLTSAWFTGVIGVHAIFGGFLIGLICPHDAGFAIKVTEKIEDIVTVLFLPLYFALSGLNTNVGLLNSGITWGYVVAVVAVAFFGKLAGGTLAARCSKLVWRESFTIGVLMSCKGLVELIVLNIGLQAKILSTRTFTIFVVMALVTTFLTTPLTSYLYPPWYQTKLDAWKRGEINWDGTQIMPEDHDDRSRDRDSESQEKTDHAQLRRLLVYLRLDSLSALVTFVGLLGGNHVGNRVQKVHPSKRDAAAASTADEEKEMVVAPQSPRRRPVQVHGVRMLELTDRTSSVMKVSELDDVRDPVVDVFHTFAQLNNVAVSEEMDVVPEDLYADTLTRKALDIASDLLLIPWGENGTLSENSDSLTPGTTENRFASGPYSHFVGQIVQNATCNTAILVNNGFGGRSKSDPHPALRRTLSGMSLRSSRDLPSAPVSDRTHHIFFPYFGGTDDRVALRFVLQLAQNTNVTATILQVNRTVVPGEVEVRTTPQASGEALETPPITDDSADADRHNQSFFTSLQDSLPPDMESRVVFESVMTAEPLRTALERAMVEVGQAPRNAGDLVVIGRHRGCKRGVRNELHTLLPSLGRPSGVGSEARQTLGELAEAVIAGNVKASIMVIQAGKHRDGA